MKSANRPVYTVWDQASSRAFGRVSPTSKSSMVAFSQLSDAEYVARCAEDYRSRTGALPQLDELSRPPVSLRGAFSLRIQRYDTLFHLIDVCAPVFLDVDFCKSIDYSRGDVRFSGVNVEVENIAASRLHLQQQYLESRFP